MEHLDNLLTLKEERIGELQKQLDRKQARRKETEAYQNSLQIPFETIASPLPQRLSIKDLMGPVSTTQANPPVKVPSSKSVEVNKLSREESMIPIKPDSTISVKPANISKHSFSEMSGKDLAKDLIENTINLGTSKLAYTKFSAKHFIENNKLIKYVEPIGNLVAETGNIEVEVDRIKSDVFKEVEIVDEKADLDEFEDSEQDTVTTIEQTIQKEIKSIALPIDFMQNLNCP